MDDAAIVALLSGIEPSEGEIPKPPFMAAIPAAPVIDAGADLDAVEVWVKARGGWTHRAPAHLDAQRTAQFFIVPKGHLQTSRPGSPPIIPVSRGGRPAGRFVAPGAATPGAAAMPGAAAPAGAGAPAAEAPSGAGTSGDAVPAASPARGVAGADLMAFAATTDLRAARAFYERGLGLKLSGQSPIAITFDCAGTTLRVVLVEKPVVAPYTVLGWTVADMASTVRDLTGRGIDFERFDGVEQDDLGIWNAPGGALVAWFKDPDGNTLSLTQF
jgi:catechol 2,3-dioxygenase-like lactoylglutathione lyase family enzyme